MWDHGEWRYTRWLTFNKMLQNGKWNNNYGRCERNDLLNGTETNYEVIKLIKL